MLTEKVRNYKNFKSMFLENVSLAIFLEMLQEFKVISKHNIGFYNHLINLHYDLKQKTQNRIKYNENRSTITEEGI